MQSCPQLPQFLASEVVSTQPLPHMVQPPLLLAGPLMEPVVLASALPPAPPLPVVVPEPDEHAATANAAPRIAATARFIANLPRSPSPAGPMLYRRGGAVATPSGGGAAREERRRDQRASIFTAENVAIPAEAWSST